MHYISATHYFDPLGETVIDAATGPAQSPDSRETATPSAMTVGLFAAILGLEIGLVAFLLWLA